MFIHQYKGCNLNLGLNYYADDEGKPAYDICKDCREKIKLV